MTNNDMSHLEQAAQYWDGGKPIEAGRIMFERLPQHVRPLWAARILRLVLSKSGLPATLFEEVLYTAENQPMWAGGHRVFSILRGSFLRLNELRKTRVLSDEEDSTLNLLSLAELVAKVTYNAVDPPDEFDEDSGWWIAACLKGFVDHWKDKEFEKEAWSALCFEEQTR